MITRRKIGWETQTQYDKNGKVKGWLYRGVYRHRTGPWCSTPGEARRELHKQFRVEWCQNKVERLVQDLADVRPVLDAHLELEKNRRRK